MQLIRRPAQPLSQPGLRGALRAARRPHRHRLKIPSSPRSPPLNQPATTHPTGRKLGSVLASTFLPAGYPATVGPNYLRFATWQAATNFAVSVNSGACF